VTMRELLITAAKGEVEADPKLLRLAYEVWRNTKREELWTF